MMVIGMIRIMTMIMIMNMIVIVSMIMLMIRKMTMLIVVMHMNMSKLEVKAGDPVTAGQHIGYVSNDFGGTPTTFHLHFEITQNDANSGWIHVPPYLSLAEAYERREGGPGEVIETGGVEVATAPFIIPEGMEIIE